MTASTVAGDRTVHLVDRRSDRRLRQYGFAKVRAMGAADAAELLALHRTLRGEAGTGFDADLNNPDLDYRRAVAEALGSRLAPVLGRLFRGGDPFLWNFLCKWPHTDEELYRHRDWMFVDERTGARSCSIWIALQDITGHNGQLLVLPGSHLVEAGSVSPSGTELAPSWVEHRDVVGERLVAVPLRAGEAVVLDHALVHASYGNHTDEARVSIGCALRPEGEALLHLRRIDDERAARYEVDPSFFTSYTPEQLLAAPPALDAVEELVAAGPVLGPDELADRLDRLGPGRRRWR